MNKAAILVLGVLVLIAAAVGMAIYYRKRTPQPSQPPLEPKPKPGEKLLSRNKPAVINPPHPLHPASRLVDGDITTFGHSAAVGDDEESYAEIDLLAPYTLTEIGILNRLDCCQDGFTTYTVSVDGKEIVSGDAEGALLTTRDLKKTKGQKVRLTKKGSLNLTGITIYGY